jgi:uroporphyrinogen decarboxylase
MVPHLEIFFNAKIASAIVPGGSYEDMIEHLDVDGVSCYTITTADYEVVDASHSLIRDRWGVVKRDTGETTPHPVEAPIKSSSDLDSYRAPDPDVSPTYDALRGLVSRFKGRRAVVAVIEQPFMRVSEIRGAAQHLMDMIKTPGLIDSLNEIVTAHHLRVIDNFADLGADIVCFSGDLATKEGPMVSRAHLEDFALRPLRRLVERVKDRSMLCILHSDGNIMPIMDILLAIEGVDALHPIDPLGGMDIGVVKQSYGHRVGLIGSIDCGPLLMEGSREEVREAVRENIRKAGSGGGLIAASSHSIHAGVNPDNYVEMVRAIREFGRYPLAL